MADLIDIEIGDQRIRVPAWATETTLEAMLKYNEIAARALNKLVGVGDSDTKTLKIQEHYFKKIAADLAVSKRKQSEILEQDKKDRKADKKESADIVKAIHDSTKKQGISGNDVVNTIKYINEMSSSIAANNILFTMLSDKASIVGIAFDELVKKVENTGSIFSGKIGGGSNPLNQTELENVLIKLVEKITGSSNKPPAQEASLDASFYGKTELYKNITKMFSKIDKNVLSMDDQLLNIIKYDVEQKGRLTRGFDPKDISKLSKIIDDLKKGIQVSVEDKDFISSMITGFKSDTKKFSGLIDAFVQTYIKSNNDELTNNERQLKTLNKMGSTISEFSKVTKSMFDGSFSLQNIAQSIGNVVSSLTGIAAAGAIVSGVLGAVVSVIEQLSKSISTLLDIGASLGSTMVQLKNSATMTGLNLENFAKIIASNASAMRILGNNTNEGMLNFASLSSKVRGIAKDFNYFGLSNTELNEAIIQEIELRRKSGQNYADLQNNLAQGMNSLLFETTAMANITGQNRRDLLRAQVTAASDPGISSYLATLSEEQQNAFRSINNMVGFLGEDLTKTMQSAIASGLPLETLFGPTLSLAGDMGKDLMNLFDVYKKGIMSGEDTKQLQSKMVEIVSNMSAANENTLRLLATAPDGTYKDMANAILQLSQNVRGFEGKTQQEVMAAFASSDANMKAQQLAALPAAMESMTNELNATIFRSVDEIIGLGKTGGSVVAAMENIEGMAKGENLQGLIKNMFDSMPDSLKLVTIAATSLTVLNSILGAINLLPAGIGAVVLASGSAGLGAMAASASATVLGLGTAILQKAGLAALLYGAFEGITDEELKKADVGIIDRTLSGIMGVGLEGLDMAAGIVNAPIDYMFGTNLGKPDLSGAWRSYELEAYNNYNASQLTTPPIGGEISDNTGSVIQNQIATTDQNTSNVKPSASTTVPANISKEDSVPYIQETNRLLGALIRKYDESFQ